MHNFFKRQVLGKRNAQERKAQPGSKIASPVAAWRKSLNIDPKIIDSIRCQYVQQFDKKAESQGALTAASSEVKAIHRPEDDIADLVLKRPRLFDDELNNTQAPSKLLTTSSQPPSNLLPTSFQSPSNLLPSSFQSPSNFLPIFYQAPPKLLPSSFQARSQLLPSSF